MACFDRNEASNMSPAASVRVHRVRGSDQSIDADFLAIEEPLDIRLSCDIEGRREDRPVSITMRTPGHDFELAVGFLFTEGILTTREQIADVRACKAKNVVRVGLRPGVAVNLARLERHFFTTSSCGVCGKTSLAALQVQIQKRPEDRPLVDSAVVHRLPATLRAAQTVFDRTGGLHAAALFDVHGQLLALREDVGRHNAVDKVLGAQFLAGQTPLSENILLVSGRASFELVQKAAVAGLPILAAVGAPSSLAVELAREQGLTILGFVRDNRFNIYSGAHRIRQSIALPDEGVSEILWAAPTLPR